MKDKNFFTTILSDTSVENRENIISAARYLSTYPLNADTLTYYLKIIDSNIEDALSAVFKNRNPETFFSILKPNYELISSILGTLTKYKIKTISLKSLYAALGIILMSYKNPKAGLKIYKISFSDIHHIAKYLLTEDEKAVNLIIEILESIWNNDMKNEISVLSKNIINCFYDNKKKLSEHIPEKLLI